MLKGIQRTKGDAINQKLPITQKISVKFATVLNLNKSIDLTFWVACLVAFYGMLRKSSLFPKHRAMSHMSVDCCEFQSSGLVIKSKYSKNYSISAERLSLFYLGTEGIPPYVLLKLW